MSEKNKIRCCKQVDTGEYLRPTRPCLKRPTYINMPHYYCTQHFKKAFGNDKPFSARRLTKKDFA